MKPYVACSVSEPVCENAQFPIEAQRAKQYPMDWWPTKEGHEPAWGYHRLAPPEVVQMGERSAASSIEEKNQTSESVMGGDVDSGPSSEKSPFVLVNIGPGDVEQESGDPRMAVRNSVPEPCPQRIQPALFRRLPVWSKDYNLM